MNIKVRTSVTDSDIARTQEFFQKAFPNPGLKNFHTQLGVHFEEIAEMLETLRGNDRITQSMLTAALIALHGLALHLKATDNMVGVVDRTEFLDALCDQLVTATGVAHMAGLDIVGGFGEVNRSNFSKFDDNGNPILDQNHKMIKGPYYQKPELEKYT